MDDLRDDLGQARSDLAQAIADRLVDRGRAERAEAEAAAERVRREAAEVITAAERERREAVEAALTEARTPWPLRLLRELRRRP
jgi:TPP-dependent pyruvate/acetoin dehydrogenase alpha subunit